MMDTYSVGDGYIHIQETQECRYQVEFENKLAHAEDIVSIDHDRLNIVRMQNPGEQPDDVLIHDRLTGATYMMTVPDNTTGKTCIPWPLLG